MDPKETLLRAAHAIDEGDMAEARDALADYADWRRRGGFEPAGGDERARQLKAALKRGKGLSGASVVAPGGFGGTVEEHSARAQSLLADALAHKRRKEDLPAVFVAGAAWAEAQWLVDSGDDRLQRHGAQIQAKAKDVVDDLTYFW